MSQKVKFYIVIAIQIGFILGMIFFHQFVLISGEKIFLKIVPIDPLDLFRGYYAHLDYDISRVFTSQIKVDREDFRKGEYIYATLTKDPGDKFYKVSAINHKKPLIKSDEFIIKGRVRYCYDIIISKVWVQTEEGKIKEYEPCWKFFKPDDEVVIYLADDDQIRGISRREKNFVPSKNQKIEYGKVIRIEERKDKELNIKYGIESYFVEETKTSVISQIQRERNLYAEISLSKDGRALISRIFLNDKPL